MQVAAAEAVIAWALMPAAAESPAVAEALKQLYALAWPSNIPLIRTITRRAAQLATGPLACAAFPDPEREADRAEAWAQICMMQVRCPASLGALAARCCSGPRHACAHPGRPTCWPAQQTVKSFMPGHCHVMGCAVVLGREARA